MRRLSHSGEEAMGVGSSMHARNEMGRLGDEWWCGYRGELWLMKTRAGDDAGAMARDGACGRAAWAK